MHHEVVYIGKRKEERRKGKGKKEGNNYFGVSIGLFLWSLVEGKKNKTFLFCLRLGDMVVLAC